MCLSCMCKCSRTYFCCCQINQYLPRDAIIVNEGSSTLDIGRTVLLSRSPRKRYTGRHYRLTERVMSHLVLNFPWELMSKPACSPDIRSVLYICMVISMWNSAVRIKRVLSWRRGGGEGKEKLFLPTLQHPPHKTLTYNSTKTISIITFGTAHF